MSPLPIFLGCVQSSRSRPASSSECPSTSSDQKLHKAVASVRIYKARITFIPFSPTFLQFVLVSHSWHFPIPEQGTNYTRLSTLDGWHRAGILSCQKLHAHGLQSTTMEAAAMQILHGAIALVNAAANGGQGPGGMNANFRVQAPPQLERDPAPPGGYPQHRKDEDYPGESVWKYELWPESRIPTTVCSIASYLCFRISSLLFVNTIIEHNHENESQRDLFSAYLLV